MAPKMIVSWLLRLGIAAMFVMAAVPKLTAQAEPAELFSQLGGAPMMYLTGLMELTAAVLLLIPRTKVYGALLAMGVMGGAIASHLAVLTDDTMLPVAIALFLAAGVVAYLHSRELPLIGGCCGACATQKQHDPAQSDEAPA